MKSIVLIGMSGCGKSTVGRLLADALSLPFLDTDALVEEAEGRTIPQLFEEEGEAYFRNAETAVAQNLPLSPAIIATGGGMILRPENMESLSQNSLVVFLDRDIEEIISSKLKGRPLFADGGDAIRHLYTNRIDLYRNYAMYTISSQETPGQTTQLILDMLEAGGQL